MTRHTPSTARFTKNAMLRIALLAVTLLASGAMGPNRCEAGEPYRATIQHSFDDAERWSKVFDAPDRASWQKPEEVITKLAIVPGATVADIGAGTGFFSRYWSEAVGPSGTVFAVDVEPNLVAYLRDRADKERTVNLVPVLASYDNPRLPAGAVDLAVIVDTYHHIDQRLEYLRAFHRVLAPDARVVVIDWKPGKLPVGPPDDHKIAADDVVREMNAAGYRLVDAPDFLPYQYVRVFRTEPSQPAKPSASGEDGK